MSSGWLSKPKRKAILLRDARKCGYCGKRVPLRKAATIDHIQPRKRGGNDNVHNLVTCCMACNQVKGSKTLSEYLTYMILEGIKTARQVKATQYRVMQMRFREISW